MTAPVGAHAVENPPACGLVFKGSDMPGVACQPPRPLLITELAAMIPREGMWNATLSNLSGFLPSSWLVAT